MREVKATAPETYLGDGVYASFDGHGIKVRAPLGEPLGDVAIWLEPPQLRALVEFARNEYRKAGI